MSDEVMTTRGIAKTRTMENPDELVLATILIGRATEDPRRNTLHMRIRAEAVECFRADQPAARKLVDELDLLIATLRRQILE